MLTSITHRLTALAMSLVGMLILTWFLVAVAAGPEAYDTFVGFASSWFGTFVLFSLSWCVAQHLASGVRHMFMDVGAGFDLRTSARTAKLTFAFSLTMTVIFWTILTLKDKI